MNPKRKREPAESRKYLPGDPIPVPEVKEEESPEVWIQWLRAEAAIERKLRAKATVAVPLN